MKWLVVAVAALLAACQPEPRPPVVVYAPAELEDALNEWLEDSAFSANVIAGDSAENTDRIIAKEDSPRADVLVTSSAIDIWRAADEGALRPIQGHSFAQVPAPLKDPDGSWAALAYRRPAIAVAEGADKQLVSSLRDLGAATLAGKVCLSSSDLPANQALVAMLIEELGVKPAERLIRGWVRNLATAAFASEADLHAALEGGDCEFGIVSGIPDGSRAAIVTLQPGYVQIDGVGVSRHAVHAEAAQGLVDWMLSDLRADELDGSVMLNAGIAGWRNEQAKLLVERAGYR